MDMYEIEVDDTIDFTIRQDIVVIYQFLRCILDQCQKETGVDMTGLHAEFTQAYDIENFPDGWERHDILFQLILLRIDPTDDKQSKDHQRNTLVFWLWKKNPELKNKTAVMFPV